MCHRDARVIDTRKPEAAHMNPASFDVVARLLLDAASMVRRDVTLVRVSCVLLLVAACGGTTRNTGANRDPGGDSTGMGGVTDAAGGNPNAGAGGRGAGGSTGRGAAAGSTAEARGDGGKPGNATGVPSDGGATGTFGTASGGSGGEPSAKECAARAQAFIRFVDEHAACSADSDCTVVGDCGPNADFVAVNVDFASEAYGMQTARCSSSSTWDGPLFGTRCERGACVLVDTDACCGCPLPDAGL